VPYTDKTLVCADCGAEFVFSAEDQEYHVQRGFMNEPRRCRSCRAMRRAQRNGEDAGTGYGAPRREMFTAICSACGKEAHVPFQPRGDRPVYCSECYQPTRSFDASDSYSSRH